MQQPAFTLERNPHCPAVVRRDGVIDLLLTHLFCRLLGMVGAKTFINYSGALVRMLNHPQAWAPRLGRLRIFGPVAEARRFLEAVLAPDCQLRRLKGGRDGVRVDAQANAARVKMLLVALKHLMDVAIDDGVVRGEHFMLLKGWRDLTEAQRAKVTASSLSTRAGRGRFKTDVGLYYRMPYKPWTPARTGDVRYFDRLRCALAEAGAPEGAQACYELVGEAGVRASEGLISMWGLLRFGLSAAFMTRNKGSGSYECKRGENSDGGALRVLAYVAGTRARHDRRGRDLAYFLDLKAEADAGDAAAEAELRATPVFLNTRGDPLTYDALRYHFDRAVELAGLPAELTIHFARHEYVFSRMRAIDALPECERAAARDALCAYMMWSTGEAMLACYDAYHRTLRAIELSAAHARNRRAGMAAATRSDLGRAPAGRPRSVSVFLDA